MKLFYNKEIALCLGQAVNGLFIALGVFGGLALARALGIGGVDVRLDILLYGLLLAEAGKIMSVFGERNWKAEYGGVWLQGLAWWVWSLNLPFMSKQLGINHFWHFAGSAAVIGAVPVLAHFFARVTTGYFQKLADKAQADDKEKAFRAAAGVVGEQQEEAPGGKPDAKP